MNNAEHLAGIIRDANRRNMPVVVAGLMDDNASVSMFVNDALAETAALRKLLADVAGARDVKTAKAIAAKAAKVPAIEEPHVAAKRLDKERMEAYNRQREIIAAEKAKRERIEQVRRAKAELARAEAEKRHLADLQKIIQDAEKDGIDVGDPLDKFIEPETRIEH